MGQRFRILSLLPANFRVPAAEWNGLCHHHVHRKSQERYGNAFPLDFSEGQRGGTALYWIFPGDSIFLCGSGFRAAVGGMDGSSLLMAVRGDFIGASGRHAAGGKEKERPMY